MEKYSSFTLTLIKFEKGEEVCLCKTSDVKKFGDDTISNGFVIKENGEVGQIKSSYKGETNKFLATQKVSTPVEKVRPLSLDDILNLRSNKDITTKEELVELIKKNFRDKNGDIDLSCLDFSGEVATISRMKAKKLFQNNQVVEESLYQNYQEVEGSLYQHSQKVDGCLYQQNQKTKGSILQDEFNKEITTKQELVKLIKKNFRDEDGAINLRSLDFSGEDVYIGYMKARNLTQSGQEVENNLFQSRQEVGGCLYQSRQTVGNNLYQNNQEVGNSLYQQYQEVRGKIFQDEANTDRSVTKKDNINPNYYKGEIECINAIEEITKGLQGVEAVATGTAIKYLWRWKNKNGVEDLEKARWYINHLIELIKSKSRNDRGRQ